MRPAFSAARMRSHVSVPSKDATWPPATHCDTLRHAETTTPTHFSYLAFAMQEVCACVYGEQATPCAVLHVYLIREYSCVGIVCFAVPRAAPPRCLDCSALGTALQCIALLLLLLLVCQAVCGTGPHLLFCKVLCDAKGVEGVQDVLTSPSGLGADGGIAVGCKHRQSGSSATHAHKESAQLTQIKATHDDLSSGTCSITMKGENNKRAAFPANCTLPTIPEHLSSHQGPQHRLSSQVSGNDLTQCAQEATRVADVSIPLLLRLLQQAKVLDLHSKQQLHA